MKTSLLAIAAALLAAPAVADAVKFELDPGHSQIVFTYDHLGYSTTYGMFSGFEGEIMFDEDEPAASKVMVSFPVRSMLTGWEGRFQHFMSADFFDAADDELVSFASTSIEVTGDNTALISGDLTMNGVTQEVVLDTTLRQASPYPFGPKQGTPFLGFEASTTVIRSEFGLGAFAPAVSDEIAVIISIEAGAAESDQAQLEQ